jgi:glyoxylase-like metal-dependent hydrolase (beta-lactamase superfamily II)
MEPINVTADATEFTCNAYLVPGEEPALVDAGSMDGVVEVIDEHVDDLERVVLTHQHSDHVEQLDAVLDAFGPELCAYGEHPRRDVALDDVDAVTLGDWTFESVYTPGHAADHLAFVAEEGLFSGDVVVYNDAAFENGSFGRTDLTGQSRERLIESLQTLLERLPEQVAAMYAGHGDPFHADGERVRDVVERALERAAWREPKYPEEN